MGIWAQSWFLFVRFYLHILRGIMSDLEHLLEFFKAKWHIPAIMFVGMLLLTIFIFGFRDFFERLVFSALFTLIIFLALYEDPVKTAEKKALIAKHEAEEALYKQKVRNSISKDPLEVQGQIALMRGQADADILIKQAEKDMKLALDKGDADEFLRFSKKKFMAEQAKKELTKKWAKKNEQAHWRYVP